MADEDSNRMTNPIYRACTLCADEMKRAVREIERLERENTRLRRLCVCPWCGNAEQHTDPRGTCAKCGLPWEFKNWLPGVDKLPTNEPFVQRKPEGGGPIPTTDQSGDTPPDGRDLARQSGSPGVDPPGECQAGIDPLRKAVGLFIAAAYRDRWPVIEHDYFYEMEMAFGGFSGATQKSRSG